MRGDDGKWIVWIYGPAASDVIFTNINRLQSKDGGNK